MGKDQFAINGVRRGFLGTRIFKHRDWESTPHGVVLPHRSDEGGYEKGTLGNTPVNVTTSDTHEYSNVQAHAGLQSAYQNAIAGGNTFAHYALNASNLELFYIIEIYTAAPVGGGGYAGMQINIKDGVNTFTLMFQDSVGEDIDFYKSGGLDNVAPKSNDTWHKHKGYFNATIDKQRFWHGDADNIVGIGENDPQNPRSNIDRLEFNVQCDAGTTSLCYLDDLRIYTDKPTGFIGAERFN